MATSDISERLNNVLLDLGESEYTKPFQKFSQLNVFCITAALMFGTAGLPHVIVRFYTVKNVRAARYSAVWAIFFIAILYTTAPALGLFARYNLVKSTHMSTIDKVTIGEGDEEKLFIFPGQREEAFDALTAIRGSETPPQVVYYLDSPEGKPLDWATRWQKTGLLKFDDLNQDGSISLKLDENGKSEQAKIDKDIIVLSTPEVAGLPPWVIALVAAGGLAAALSTAAGLLLVISSSLAHDLYCRYCAPKATEAQKVMIGRIAILLGIVVAGYFGINPPGFVGEVVAFAFGLAAASFFPAIFLGIFSKRVNRAGAVSGMIVGLAFTMTYIVMCTSHKVLPMFFEEAVLKEADWLFGISPQGIGTVGMLLNFVVTIVVTSMTPPPPPEVIDLIDSVRVPKGSGKATEH